METKKDIQEELSELSPFLSNLRNEQTTSGFDVPPNYFKQLTAEVMHEVAPVATADTASWWNKLWLEISRLMFPRLAMGIMTALLIFVGIWYLNPAASTVEIAQSEPTLEELESYLATHLDEFDTEELLLQFPSANYKIEEDALDEILDDLEVEDLEDLL